jgi:hypothetical protein
MADPGYIQVAPDGSGKKMRTEIDSVKQPDQTYADVHREIVSGPPEFIESAHESKVRQLLEAQQVTLDKILLVLLIIAGPTSSQGVSDIL